MAVDVAQAIKDFIQRIIDDRETAVEYSADPEGSLVAEGITEADLSDLDMFQLVSDNFGSVPALRDYASGTGSSVGSAGGSSVNTASGTAGGSVATGAATTSSAPVGGSVASNAAASSVVASGDIAPPPASAPGHSVEEVIQHVTYVTHETHKGDETIVQNLEQFTKIENVDNSATFIDESTTIDQSQETEVEVDAEGAIIGELEVDTEVESNDTNVNALGDDNLVNTGTNLGQQNTGEDSVVTDGDVTQAADGGIAVGDDLEGNVAQSGDGGFAVGDDIDAPVNTGDGGIAAEDSQINTGEFAGVQAGDDAELEGGALSFGEGDVSNAQGNELDDGAALSQGGDATGTSDETNIEDSFNQDNDATVTEDNDVTTTTEDSFNEETEAEVTTEVEDSFNAETEVTNIEDNDVTTVDVAQTDDAGVEELEPQIDG